MEIILVRHGKPDINTLTKVSALGFGDWVKQYDAVGIHKDSQPPNELISLINNCSYVVCSNLLRSTESAKLLHITEPNLISQQYRECEMPYTKWNFPKLSKTTWAVLFRLLQLLGFSPNSESYKEIKIRALQCANQLQELSSTHQSVTFIGHGVLNHFIHKQLLSLGWFGPQKATRKHWDYAVYESKNITNKVRL